MIAECGKRFVFVYVDRRYQIECRDGRVTRLMFVLFSPQEGNRVAGGMDGVDGDGRARC